MSMVFDLVLGVFREPGLIANLRDKELPEDLSLVIRLAAGERAALQCALDATGEIAETLVDASVFFCSRSCSRPVPILIGCLERIAMPRRSACATTIAG